MTGKNNSLGLIICLAFCIATFPVLILYNKWQSRQDQKILEEGIKTTGTLVDNDYYTDDSGATYYVRFDFQVDNRWCYGYANLRDNSRYYDEAIVGMKYVVRYLPEEPDKVDNSRIYLDSAIVSEYVNIKKERGRIVQDYRDGKKFIKKARPIPEIRWITE